jgi:hypothetical protein
MQQLRLAEVSTPLKDTCITITITTIKFVNVTTIITMTITTVFHHHHHPAGNEGPSSYRVAEQAGCAFQLFQPEKKRAEKSERRGTGAGGPRHRLFLYSVRQVSEDQTISLISNNSSLLYASDV